VPRETTKFDKTVHLNTPEDRAAYIEAEIGENDPEFLVKAIGAAVRAIGVGAFAERTGLSRSAVYKAFIHEGGNPTIQTICKALDVIGMQLFVKGRRIEPPHPP